MTKARKGCHGHKHKKWGVFQICTFHFMHTSVDLSKTCTGDILVWAELVIKQGGHLQGMHSRRFTQEVRAHAHALSNSVWGCDSVPLGRHILAGLFQSSLQTGSLLCDKLPELSDLTWKEALVDDLVLPAAQWPKYVFLLTYTGAFNLLLYWALFDFTYHYHNDMLVESRANHGLCTVPTSNVIRLN